MFAAFEAGDIDGVVATVSDDTLWIYHGTQVIPPNEFRNKERVRKFFTSILWGTDVLKFEREQYIEQDNVVVVLGNEHQRVKKSGKELKQKWVQIYTVENELITHMEEFATSEVVKP
ncbi:MAG: nuclear transport factor 2 family protein [Bacteroidetes bacterium]|jgi:ketosteroid isomerase-like protein|nr:nuclear transport factor 2 family protein [Bacteroidota bacterium]